MKAGKLGLRTMCRFHAMHIGSLKSRLTGPHWEDVVVDLKEFSDLLDKYYISLDNSVDFTKTSGGVGEVKLDANGNPFSRMSSKGLMSYLNSAGGLDFLILHEFSHMMGIAKSFTASEYSSWIAAGGTDATWRGDNGRDGSANLYISESYVNNLARSMETKLNIPGYAQPGGGYNYTGTLKGQ